MSTEALTGCAWLDATQRSAIYRPTFAKANTFNALNPNDEVVFLALNSSVRSVLSGTDPSPNITGLPADVTSYISAWWLPTAKTDSPTILYFHGVFRNLTFNYRKINALREAGFNVLAVTYRGWPATSKELPSEQSIYQDAERGFAELVRRQPDPKKRLLYGHSLGGGVAVELASRLKYRQDYAALMLESTFTSLADVASELRWYGRLLQPFGTQRFDSLSKIKKVDAPVLIRHGDADSTVPFILGERLFDAAIEPKKFVRFIGGTHSDLDLEQAAIYQSTAWEFWRQVMAEIRSD